MYQEQCTKKTVFEKFINLKIIRNFTVHVCPSLAKHKLYINVLVVQCLNRLFEILVCLEYYRLY